MRLGTKYNIIVPLTVFTVLATSCFPDPLHKTYCTKAQIVNKKIVVSVALGTDYTTSLFLISDINNKIATQNGIIGLTPENYRELCENDRAHLENIYPNNASMIEVDVLERLDSNQLSSSRSEGDIDISIHSNVLHVRFPLRCELEKARNLAVVLVTGTQEGEADYCQFVSVK